VDALFAFFIDHALGDLNALVRNHALEAGTNIINAIGEQSMTKLLRIFEGYLDSPAPDSERSDRIRESVVIFLGTLASHLQPGDSKVLQFFLLHSLHTIIFLQEKFPLSHHTPHHITSHHITPHHITPHHTTSHHTTPHPPLNINLFRC